MTTPGTFISAFGHVGLIGWLIVGWGLQAAPLQMDTIDISVISGAAFDQMRAGSTPNPGDAAPTAAPVIADVAPMLPDPETPAIDTPQAAPVDTPQPETLPNAPPQLDMTDVADALPPMPAQPEAPPPAPDIAVSDTPIPPRAPTVASAITAPPPPDAVVDDTSRDAVTADPDVTADIAAREQQATAPAETTTQIVIADLAPSSSVRPMVRPTRPAPPATTAQETQVADVAAALQTATAADAVAAPALPAGPPMTGAERDSFRIAVNRCWNVDPGSVAARVTVEVGFSLSPDGRVIGNDVALLASDGDASATNTAFEAARRAILRCQSGGYDLPADKYDQWQDVVITFDPSGMRLR